MSKTCTQGVPDIEEEDKLLRVVRGAYYGHANRKRGATDPRQCIWHSSNEAGNSEYTAPMASLPSSSDGILEFQSDHFGKQMRGDLLVSKFKGRTYGVQASLVENQRTDSFDMSLLGGMYRVILSSDGMTVAESPFLFDEEGDLAIVQGPEGA
jgi:hypothetical protein